jgi:predicted DNA-binding transcriptional regulator AlpA
VTIPRNPDRPTPGLRPGKPHPSEQPYCGTAEIAILLGDVSRQRVYQLASDNRTFPAAAARLAQGDVWLTAAVLEWIREHRPELDVDGER